MPRDVVRALGLRAYNDPEELRPICKKVVESEPAIVSQYRKGKTKVIGKLIKLVMDETQSGADPKITTNILKGLLSDESRENKS